MVSEPMFGEAFLFLSSGNWWREERWLLKYWITHCSTTLHGC